MGAHWPLVPELIHLWPLLTIPSFMSELAFPVFHCELKTHSSPEIFQVFATSLGQLRHSAPWTKQHPNRWPFCVGLSRLKQPLRNYSKTGGSPEFVWATVKTQVQ